MPDRRVLFCSAVLGGAVVLLAGCRVERGGSGGGEHFQMATPFGGLQVRTDEKALETGIGLPIFPGAVLERKAEDKNNGAADIDLSLGNLRLRVKALSYRTDAAPAEVQAFYAKELARYGPVITCRDHRPVGTPTQTPEGLTCEQRGGGKGVATEVDPGDDGGEGTELKAGSPQHQRIVAVATEGGRTKFGLVLLDLPRRLTTEDGGK